MNDHAPGTLLNLAVALVDFHGAAHTARCIESIEASAAGENRARPGIVVVNTGHPDSGALLQLRHPGAAHIEAGGNVGFGAACNLAIRYLRSLPAPPKYVLLLNNDTVVETRALETLVRFLDEHPDVAAATPKIMCMDEPNTLWAAGCHVALYRAAGFNRGAYHGDAGQYDRAEEVAGIPGCAFCARLEAFETGGEFDPAFFLYFEDAELCARWRRHALRLWYVPQARVWHHAGASTGGVFSRLESRLDYRNRLLFARRTLSAWRWAVFFFAFFPLILLRDAWVFFRARRFRAYSRRLLGVVDFLRGQTGRPYFVDEHPECPSDIRLALERERAAGAPDSR